ncbi:hypothetical protein [Fusibacter sp. JL216-2]|uniref:hypothetical protein n=1 Tax=Fusibacter sp. JL216-2 TaxID=3071453 RepID=UPI003D33CEB4
MYRKILIIIITFVTFNTVSYGAEGLNFDVLVDMEILNEEDYTHNYEKILSQADAIILLYDVLTDEDSVEIELDSEANLYSDNTLSIAIEYLVDKGILNDRLINNAKEMTEFEFSIYLLRLLGTFDIVDANDHRRIIGAGLKYELFDSSVYPKDQSLNFDRAIDFVYKALSCIDTEGQLIFNKYLNSTSKKEERISKTYDFWLDNNESHAVYKLDGRHLYLEYKNTGEKKKIVLDPHIDFNWNYPVLVHLTDKFLYVNVINKNINESDYEILLRIRLSDLEYEYIENIDSVDMIFGRYAYSLDPITDDFDYTVYLNRYDLITGKKETVGSVYGYASASSFTISNGKIYFTVYELNAEKYGTSYLDMEHLYEYDPSANTLRKLMTGFSVEIVQGSEDIYIIYYDRKLSPEYNDDETPVWNEVEMSQYYKLIRYDNKDNEYETLMESKIIYDKDNSIIGKRTYEPNYVLGINNGFLYSSRSVTNEDMSIDTKIERLDLNTLEVVELETFVGTNHNIEYAELKGTYLGCTYYSNGYAVENLYILQDDHFQLITVR